jgi:hypothetical protein
MDARGIADEFARQWGGTWVVTLDLVTIFHLRVVDGIRTIAVATHPSMLSPYIEYVGEWCEAPVTCRVAATTDRNNPGVRWLTLMSRCPVCLPKLIGRVVEHELAGLPADAPRQLAMTPTQDLRGRAVRIGGRTVMTASFTARRRLAGHAPARHAPLPPIAPAPPLRSTAAAAETSDAATPATTPLRVAARSRHAITPSRRVAIGPAAAEEGSPPTTPLPRRAEPEP